MTDTTTSAPPPAAPADPSLGYLERAERHRAAADGIARRGDRVSRARVVAFLLASGLVVAVDGAPAALDPWLLAGGAVAAAVFVLLVRRHRRLRAREAWERARHDVAAEGLARLERRWGVLPPAGPPPEEGHPYAADLDLFGPASVSQLLGPVATAPGRATLRGWLEAPAPPADVAARAAAARELAPDVELRESFAARGRLADDVSPEALERFLAWAERPGRLAPGSPLHLAAWVLPALTVPLAVAWALGASTGLLWLVPFALQVLVLARWLPGLQREMGEAGDGAAGLGGYAPLVRAAGEVGRGEGGGGGRLAALRGALEREGLPAHAWLARLARRLDTVESRANMAYQALALLFLADVHLFRSLERWKGAVGGEVRGWLEAVGELEALSALATLAHDHPSWCWPEIRADGPAVVEARALGHPLLHPARCVRNDVAVGPPGSVLLVTGSNMSGKSTLLRAVGVNVVLAQAGGPACAERLTLPPLRPWTSMRVHDSLADGESHFMAELRRLRAVVEAVRAGDGDPSAPPVLYLLDEILQGTNTAERRVASREVLEELLERKAIGAVTSHDLELAADPALEGRAVPVHFRETVGSDDDPAALSFDHRLREGVATSRNALALVAAMGLGRRGRGHGHGGREAGRPDAGAGRPRAADTDGD